MSTSISKKQLSKSSCCDACLKMTTTLAALKELVSSGGYIHVIPQGPASGCHICAIIRGDPNLEDKTISRVKINGSWDNNHPSWIWKPQSWNWKPHWYGSKDLREYFRKVPILTLDVWVYVLEKDAKKVKFRGKVEFNVHALRCEFGIV